MFVLFKILFIFSSTVRANNVVAFPLNEMSGPRCEFFVSAERMRRHRVDTLLLSEFDVRAQLNPDVTPLALHAFGMTYVRTLGAADSLAVRITYLRKRWWLEIVSRVTDKIFYRVDLSHLTMREWNNPIDNTERSYGLRWSDGPLLSRYYYSVQSAGRTHQYAIGLDVPCSRLRRFTEGPVAESVLGDNNLFCRVPVLTLRRRLTRN